MSHEPSPTPSPGPQPRPTREPDPFPKMITWTIAATIVLFFVVAAVLFIDFIQRAKEGTKHPLGRPPVELFDDMPAARTPLAQPTTGQETPPE